MRQRIRWNRRVHTRWARVFNLPNAILWSFVFLFAANHVGPFTDTDTPWHVATGLYILAHHQIPRVDPFSWTMRGQPWVTQEWLFEVVLAWLLSRWGFASAIIAFDVVYALTVFVAYRTACRLAPGNRVISALIAGLCAWMSYPFWTMRPQIVSYWMFAVFLWLLVRVRQGHFRSLFLVPVLMLVWANAHASAILGPLMLGFEAVVGILPPFGRITRHSLPKGARWRLLAAALVGGLVGLLNPNGWHEYTYALLSSDPEMTNHIVEWFSPNFHTSYYQFVVLPAMLVTFVIMAAHRSNVSWQNALYVLGTFALTLIHQRFVPYFGLTLALILPKALASIKGTLRFELPRVPAKWMRDAVSLAKSPVLHRWVSYALIFVLVTGPASLFGVREPRLQGPLRQHWSSTVYPVGAVNYLLRHGLTYHVLNSYQYGGYFIYRGIPTFIDGRTDVFLQNDTFQNYLIMEEVGAQTDQLLNQYQIDTVVFPAGSTLVTYLLAQPAWKSVYDDDGVMVLVRQPTGVGV